jgi:flagellin FlaB
MFKSKKAEAGIGTLILFIALILVAAVAAGVLIQTSGSLQSKALATGSKAQTQVSTQLAVNLMWGEDGTLGNVSRVYAELKLAPGSDALKLNDTLLEFVLSDASVSLTNNGTVAQCDQGIVSALPAGTFATEYLVQSSSYKADYVQQGDVIRICFETPREVLEAQSYRFLVIPRSGGLTQINGRTPDVMASYQVSMFP